MPDSRLLPLNSKPTLPHSVMWCWAGILQPHFSFSCCSSLSGPAHRGTTEIAKLEEGIGICSCWLPLHFLLASRVPLFCFSAPAAAAPSQNSNWTQYTFFPGLADPAQFVSLQRNQHPLPSVLALEIRALPLSSETPVQAKQQILLRILRFFSMGHLFHSSKF